MDKTFEKALEELEIIVKELENGVELDTAIVKYTEAMKLAKFCSEKLAQATQQVNKILTEQGELKDFEVTE